VVSAGNSNRIKSVGVSSDSHSRFFRENNSGTDYTSPVVLSVIVPDIETLPCDCDHEAKWEVKKEHCCHLAYPFHCKLLAV